MIKSEIFDQTTDKCRYLQYDVSRLSLTSSQNKSEKVNAVLNVRDKLWFIEPTTPIFFRQSVFNTKVVLHAIKTQY
jgi:hypothetical protein